MGGETSAGRDHIFVDHAQRTKLGVLWVIVSIERECEAALQPGNLVVAALFGTPNLEHVLSPSEGLRKPMFRWLVISWV
jgi:hypothetical protein